MDDLPGHGRLGQPFAENRVWRGRRLPYTTMASHRIRLRKLVPCQTTFNG